MNMKQKSFLDDFAKLLKQYNIDSVQVDGEHVIFYSNFEALKIQRFATISGNPKFLGVTADYKPEESELDNE
jgi:hypothetical protein